MAHAGTPTDLARQPATSTTNGLWQALLAAIVLMAVVATSVFIGTNVAKIGSAAPAANNRIEAQRGPTTAAAAMIYVAQIQAQRGPSTAAAALIYVGDDSYTQVEKNRGFVAAPAVDHRLDAIETQGGVAAPAVAPDRRFDELMLAPAGLSWDGSYTWVEKNRGGAFTTSDSSYTQVEKNRGGALTAPKVGGTAPGPGTSGFVPDYGPGTSGTVPGYGPGRILGHRNAEFDQ